MKSRVIHEQYVLRTFDDKVLNVEKYDMNSIDKIAVVCIQVVSHLTFHITRSVLLDLECSEHSGLGLPLHTGPSPHHYPPPLPCLDVW